MSGNVALLGPDDQVPAGRIVLSNSDGKRYAVRPRGTCAACGGRGSIFVAVSDTASRAEPCGCVVGRLRRALASAAPPTLGEVIVAMAEHEAGAGVKERLKGDAGRLARLRARVAAAAADLADLEQKLEAVAAAAGRALGEAEGEAVMRDSSLAQMQAVRDDVARRIGHLERQLSEARAELPRADAAIAAAIAAADEAHRAVAARRDDLARCRNRGGLRHKVDAARTKLERLMDKTAKLAGGGGAGGGA